MTTDSIDAGHVIAVLREQLSDAHWQIALLRAEVAQVSAALDANLPDADAD